MAAAADLIALHAGVAVRKIMVEGAQRPLDARLYTPEAPAAAPGLIIFFHQGGFTGGGLDDGEEFALALALRTGYQILAPTYTLAGEKPFPAAAEDSHAILVWGTKNPSILGWNGKLFLTAGIEAGGNLAAVSALMARDRGGPALAAQILIMPMLDPGLTTCSMRDLTADTGTVDVADACAAGYRGYLPRAADRAHPYASPLQTSRLKDLPAALILSVETDPLRDEAEQYGAKLIAAGTKTLVKRLSATRLQEPGARCECASKVSALNEIAAFIDGLDPDAA
ncbi:MAG: alpha/beta hydrolase [Herminiimonas sp.]|nr:alpha/beta hydrolase [Herminiimonas sp.]